MFDSLKRRWYRRKLSPSQGFSFSRPLVLLHSDGWGRVGVRDREGYEQLRTIGIPLGQNPFDYYSLETSDDVIALTNDAVRPSRASGSSL